MMVEYDGHQIFKAISEPQLNANPIMSKDRLTHAKNSLNFNNNDNYMLPLRPFLCWLDWKMMRVFYCVQKLNSENCLKNNRRRPTKNGISTSNFQRVDNDT